MRYLCCFQHQSVLDESLTVDTLTSLGKHGFDHREHGALARGQRRPGWPGTTCQLSTFKFTKQMAAPQQQQAERTLAWVAAQLQRTLDEERILHTLEVPAEVTLERLKAAKRLHAHYPALGVLVIADQVFGAELAPDELAQLLKMAREVCIRQGDKAFFADERCAPSR